MMINPFIFPVGETGMISPKKGRFPQLIDTYPQIFGALFAGVVS